ncbi:hypothetical protein [Flexithrix dorotheae]|uniref:hypothetical protein n=1 Tax=Flexithrix dorotheae TaxID=70993 RepID=UPI00037706C2|nr:hypothetical protein [Flexithrix dorotheae]
MVNLLFSFHLPIILRNYHFLEIGKSNPYFDEEKQEEFVKKQALSCYKPGLALILDLIEKSQGSFKCSFALPGYVVELWEKYAPELISPLEDILKSGVVEWPLQPFYDCLTDRISKKELKAQVVLQKKKMLDFGITPGNTLLVYEGINLEKYQKAFSDTKIEQVVFLQNFIEEDFKTELVHQFSESPVSFLVAGGKKKDLLVDDLLFSDKPQEVIGKETLAHFLQIASPKNAVLEHAPFEIFGNEKAKLNGISDLFQKMLWEDLEGKRIEFATIAELLERKVKEGLVKIVESFPINSFYEPELNNMQRDAISTIYKLKSIGKTNPDVKEIWRKLLSKNHFTYFETGSPKISILPNPYPSPFDAYINFMNIASDLAGREG